MVRFPMLFFFQQATTGSALQGFGNMFATPRLPVRSTNAGNVKVFVRTRPLLQTEREESENIIYASSTDRQVVIEDGSDKSFHYDGVFGEDARQEEVYMQTVAPLVSKVKEKHNATVIAYGQTGSGKTYTMGTCPCISKVNEGILQRVLQELLSVDENQTPTVDDCFKPPTSASYLLTLSMVEIYSEAVYDLLASKKELKIKNEIGGGASIVGLVEEHIDTMEKGLALLEKGTNLRSIGTTTMNSGSSRSHALIFLSVKQGNQEGCLKLVDLAGAESVGRAHSSGLQFTEGVNINKGLLTLGKVLAALSSSSGHVPYRESLLTRVLKDSLGSGSYTRMIACVNPSSSNVHETINTLRYAEQARNIRLKVQALSTIKKRRLEDVSANSGAWKKRALSTEKASHNSTISTPGHKPPVRKLAPLLNNTVATPSESVRGLDPLHEQKHTFEIGKTLFPPPYRCTLPSLAKHICEDDSPGLSILSSIEEIKRSPSSHSPITERIKSCLETTMMAQLENFENRVADTVIAKLTRKNKGKQARKTKKKMGISLCSTPTDDGSSSGTDAESSCDNILEKTIAQAFLRKSKIKNVLEEAVSSVFGRYAVASKEASNRDVAGVTEVKPLLSNFTTKPFQDVTNISHCQKTFYRKECLDERQGQSAFFQTPSVPTFQEYKQKDLPITSTAVCETRMARRSTRVSTRMSLHRAMFNKLSPEVRSHPDVTTSMNESDHPSLTSNMSIMQANATVIKANSDSLVLDSFSTSTNCEITEDLLKQNIDTINKDKQNSKPEKTNRRRSTRLESLKATQRNHILLQNQSPVSTTTKKRRSCSTRNVSLNRSVSKINRKANTSMTTAMSTQNLTMMASPSLQGKHNDSILNILNTGSLRELQQLPTVGPKTAMVMSNFRKLYGKLNTIDELGRVPGLSRNFYSRFTKANLVTGVLQQQ